MSLGGWERKHVILGADLSNKRGKHFPARTMLKKKMARTQKRKRKKREEGSVRVSAF